MRYCEIGGTGGPAGATGGGTEAVTAGGAGCAGDNPESEDSGYIRLMLKTLGD